LSLNNHPLIEVPTLVTNKRLEEWITVVDKEKLIFETEAIGQPDNQKVTLKPFYDIHHERYNMYWYKITDEEYKHFHDEEKERKQKEQKVGIDEVTPHEQQPEIEHNIQISNSHSGYSNDVRSGWRDARDGGFFSYDMKVDPAKSMYLQVTYNKSDFK